MFSRSSGLLLPVFSLPSPFGIGDVGPSAYRFADFLHAAGQRIWQVLPLNPTDGAFGHSPYHSSSCFAFNPLLISPEILAADGWIDPEDLRETPFPKDSVDYADSAVYKGALLENACRRFRQSLPDRDYDRFCTANAFWLDDYALYRAISTRYPSVPWNQWPQRIRNRHPEALARLHHRMDEPIAHRKIEQYLFHRQWKNLVSYCRERCVHIFGDLPIYVPLDSADVWAHRRLFKLDRRLQPRFVSGVPPDYFSADGQLWGHPVYDWPALQKTRYRWWIRRIAHQTAVFDVVRIDHFRGLVACWEVPAGETTAKSGQWTAAPADDFLSELQRRFVSLPLVAEDLGHITADVRETMQRFGLPGMRVLMFGFSGNPAENPNTFHHIPENSVTYTGTHDNNTVRGWFEKEASAAEKQRLRLVCGRTVRPREVAWELIRLAMLSPARWSVIPVQDLLGLPSAARMNTPGKPEGNWRWRLTDRSFDALPADRLREMTVAFGRD